MPSRLQFLLLVALLAIGSNAAAAVPEVPIRVDIVGTSDCGPPDPFYAQVRLRTEHARRAREGEPGWSAAITVKAVGNRRLARMTLKATEGEWIDRELVAPNCDDALEALAVVLAVLVDTAVNQSLSNTRSASESEDERLKPIALPRVATGVYIPWIDDPDFFEKRGVSLSASRFAMKMVGSAELDTQLSWQPALGMGLGFEIERWSPSLLRPRFGLGLGWAAADLEVDRSIELPASASIRLQRWSLRAHLCPFDLLQARWIGLRPCGRLDAGFVYGRFNWEDEARRFTVVRTSPYLQLSIVPFSGAELRVEGGLDLAVRSAVYGDWTTGESAVRFQSPPSSGPYAGVAAAVEL